LTHRFRFSKSRLDAGKLAGADLTPLARRHDMAANSFSSASLCACQQHHCRAFRAMTTYRISAI
jgi:hypothetical protein